MKRPDGRKGAEMRDQQTPHPELLHNIKKLAGLYEASTDVLKETRGFALRRNFATLNRVHAEHRTET
jgi:hypothetical protein